MKNKSTSTNKKMDSRLANFLVANLLLLCVTIITVLLSKTMAFLTNETCTFKQKTGIICPFCGGTRCAVNIMHFNIVEAFKYHPSTTITFIYIIIIDLVYLVDLIKGKECKRIVYRVDLIVYAYLIISAIVYIIRLICIFNNIDCQFMYLKM